MKDKQYKVAVKYNSIHIVIMIFSLFIAAALIGGEIWRETNTIRILPQNLWK